MTSFPATRLRRLRRTESLRALVREEDVLAFRGRGMTPESPVVRGTAQNPDVFFQAREAVNSFYAAVPTIVQEEMAKLGERTYIAVSRLGDNVNRRR